MKTLYKAEQQVKFLHLQAEIEFLLQQQQTLKQQRLTYPQGDVSQRDYQFSGK